MRDIIERLLDHRSLSDEEAFDLMTSIASGAGTDAQLAAVLTAFESKGPTAGELAGFVRALRPHAIPVDAPDGTLDTCGTGGDGAGTFNVSTVAAFVVAGCGVPVAKHGARSASSRCGSADVLEALGVATDLDRDEAAARLRRDRFAFLFAGKYHPAMARVAPLRCALGIRTLFNLIGPLLNPAGVRRQVLGVSRERHIAPMAGALARLGAERAFVVHGAGRLDELSPGGENLLAEVHDGAVRTFRLDSTSLGLKSAPPEALRGGGAADNAAIALSILAGERGPRRDAVLLNAAAALVAADAAESFAEGLARASESIDRGDAAAVLQAARGPAPAAEWRHRA